MGLWMWTQKKVVATSKWNLFPFTVSIATQHIVTVSTSSRLKFFPGFKNFCLLKGVWYKLSTNLTNKMAYEVFWLVCGNWWGSFHLHDLLSCKRKNRSCNLFAGHAEARFGPTRIFMDGCLQMRLNHSRMSFLETAKSGDDLEYIYYGEKY